MSMMTTMMIGLYDNNNKNKKKNQQQEREEQNQNMVDDKNNHDSCCLSELVESSLNISLSHDVTRCNNNNIATSTPSSSSALLSGRGLYSNGLINMTNGSSRSNSSGNVSTSSNNTATPTTTNTMVVVSNNNNNSNVVAAAAGGVTVDVGLLSLSSSSAASSELVFPGWWGDWESRRRTESIQYNNDCIMNTMKSSKHHQKQVRKLKRITRKSVNEKRVTIASLVKFHRRRLRLERSTSSNNSGVISSSSNSTTSMILPVSSNNNNNNNMMITSLRVRGGDIDCAANNVDDEKEDVVTSTFSSSSSSNNSSAYYLIWSPGFVKQFLLATVILVTIRYRWDFNNINKFSSIISAPFISNIVLPLLSSSCCVIQMAVNTLSSIFLAGTGCIGFNSMLGPVRPYLLAVTLFRFRSMPSLSLTSISSLMSLLLSFLLRYTIVFMPEIVFWWNKILRSKWERQRQQMIVTKTATITTTNSITTNTGKETTQQQLLQATLVVDVPSMGCVACVNKIESSLRQKSSLKKNISNTDSWLTKDDSGGGSGGGCARIDICYESETELDEVINIVINTIEDSGFRGTTIKSVDLHNHSSPSSSSA
mmetsp:Transcript_28312/g.32118  ORF Transcript_28312/g.32118 Transcript_28312/m.32118 type:complete len:594 (+) Transcript_28312:184-1965(+)